MGMFSSSRVPADEGELSAGRIPAGEEADDAGSGTEELFSAPEIAARVAALGGEIGAFYRGKPLTVVAMMNGGAFFACDLARAIPLPLWFDAMTVTSFHRNRRGGLRVLNRLKLPVAGRHILLADDVFDSGATFAYCRGMLLDEGALSVRSAVLVNKRIPGRSEEPEWFCFHGPDRFLFGFGMDSEELYRNLPSVRAVQRSKEVVQ